jgi:hypothetical protein
MTEKTALTPKTHTTPPAKFSHGVKKGNILQVAGQVGFLPAEDGKPPTPPPCASRPSRPSPTSRRSWRRAARAGTT